MEILEVGLLGLSTHNSPLITHLDYGELAQLARALDLHSRGHRFDSDILHDEYFKE